MKLSLLIWFGWLMLPAGLAQAAGDSSVLIENVTLIDGTGKAPLAGAWVLVEDERIAVISRQPQTVGDTVRRIDGTGKYLIPGLIDSHIHLPGGRTGPGNRQMVMDPETGLKVLHGYLYSGVTSVYDSGNHDAFIHKMRADERAGRIVSPRIFATVSLIAPDGGHGCCAGGTPVTSYQDAVEKLEPLLLLEPDLLKFTRERRGMGPVARDMPLLPEDLFKQLVTYANERGVRTTVHVSEQSLARQAIDAGASAFAHLPYLDRIDAHFANLVAVRGISISTTITRNEAAVEFYKDPAFVALLTPEELEAALRGERYVGTEYARWLASLRPNMFHNIRELHRAGAILALGTDRTFGAMPHQELKLLVEAGIPPIDALRIGTLNAAIYIGAQNELGSLEVGKLADMVLLRQDPTADIGNTTSIEAIFKGGSQIDRGALKVVANGR
ncbi:MAG: amidohydrolase family protein [Gammaproteobacteria bacterium]